MPALPDSSHSGRWCCVRCWDVVGLRQPLFALPSRSIVFKFAVWLCRCLGLKVLKRILGGLLSLVDFNYFREFNTLGYIVVYILCLGVYVFLYEKSVGWFRL
jgi:hypothetical protein